MGDDDSSASSDGGIEGEDGSWDIEKLCENGGKKGR
jgi:hypothetical protein